VSLEEQCIILLLRGAYLYDKGSIDHNISPVDNHFLFVSLSLSVSCQSTVIISLVAALFTAPVNSLVDFLFMDILAAPLVTAKVDEERQPNPQLHQRKEGPNSKEGLLVRGTTRLVPLSLARTRTLTIMSTRNTIKLTKSKEGIHPIQNQTTTNKGKGKRESNRIRSVIRPPVSATNGMKTIIATQEDLNPHHITTDVEDDYYDPDLFQNLITNIKNQRKVLKATQLDSFDALWW
jgi:hypothetical protein